MKLFIKKISEDSSVTIGVVVVIVGVGSYVTLLQASVTNNIETISRMKDRIHEQENKIGEMQGDIKVIKHIIVREFGED